MHKCICSSLLAGPVAPGDAALEVIVVVYTQIYDAYSTALTCLLSLSKLLVFYRLKKRRPLYQIHTRSPTELIFVVLLSVYADHKESFLVQRSHQSH